MSAKVTHDSVMDAGLNVIKTGATVMHVCTTLAATATRAQAITASLANVAVATGDFTLADGTTSGRKFTTAAKNAVAVTGSGNAEQVVLIDGTNVLDMTTCTLQALTSGNTVNIPAWTHEIGDAT
jgi:hypothetical protein